MSLCCNAHQIDVIVAVCAYTVLILGTWRVDAVVKPFKLLAVFVGWGVVWLVISLGLWAGGVCYLVLHVGGHLDL